MGGQERLGVEIPARQRVRPRERQNPTVAGWQTNGGPLTSAGPSFLTGSAIPNVHSALLLARPISLDGRLRKT